MESDDEADLKKIVDIITVSQEDSSTELEYQEFINSDDSDDDEDEIDSSENDKIDDIDKTYQIDISTIYKYSPNASLKPEEKAIIDSCEDFELKNILILNRQKNIQLIQLYKKFKDLLIECKQNLVDKNDLITQYSNAQKAHSQSSGSWRLGAPYFKDKTFYVAPANDDVLRKKANNELSYYDFQLPKKWTKFEYDRLINAVKFNYNSNQILEVKRNINQLSSSDDAEKETKIQDLELRLRELNDTDNLEVPPLGSDKNINWIRVAETFLKDRYSDFECRSCWNMVAHPAINKSKWTAKENKQLLALVTKYNSQNWIQIAKELGTNRTCLNVCQYYFSQFYNGLKRGEFTFNEDRKLLQLVDEYRMGNIIPWTKISRHFKNRSRAQLHHRFIYYLNQSDKKRGKFSDAEDVIILLCVKKFGRHFKKCAEYLPDRSTAQIKTRYTSSLKPGVKRGTWTVEEDRKIYEFAQKHGSMWTELSQQEGMQRATGQIRQRYVTICDYFKSHPNAKIEDIPRRKHSLDVSFTDRFDLINEAINRFTDSPLIPSLREVEDMLLDIKEVPFVKVESYNQELDEELKPFTDIDSLLTDFFWNNLDQEVKIVSRPTLKKTIEETEIVLDVLKANLNIPEDLSTYTMLDTLDKDILKELRKSKNVHKNSSISAAIPPNFFSTTGIRSLLVKNYKFINSPKDKIFCDMDVPLSVKSRIKSEINKELSEMKPTDKQNVELDRALFYERFLSIFKWPAILTLDQPTKEMLSITENIQFEFKPLVKRTYSRIKNPEEKLDTAKKIKVVENKESLKLTPVTDKSIIMNLMHDTSKKLFRLNQVQCGDQTKTVIEEVDVRNIQSTSKCSVKKIVKPNNRKKVALRLNKFGRKVLDSTEDSSSSNKITKNIEMFKKDVCDSENVNDSIVSLMDVDVTDNFDAGGLISDNNDVDDDLTDLQKLSEFIKAEKHRE